MPNFTKSIAPLSDRPAPRGQVVLSNSKSIAAQRSIAARNRPPFDIDKMRSIVPLSTRPNVQPISRSV